MAETEVLEVYLDLLSQPCRAVHIFLSHNKIPHKLRIVALRKGELRNGNGFLSSAIVVCLLVRFREHKTPEFTKLNPMQQVPVMVDKGFVLTESDAILKYLATNYNVPEYWYPRDPERRARVDEYTVWHHTNIRPPAAKVFLIELVDLLMLEKALGQLSETLDKLESMFLKRQAFLCGDDIMLADLLAVCEIMQRHSEGAPRVKLALKGDLDDAHWVVYHLRDKSASKL
ncbi:Glutathione S-transferase theta-1-like [Scleropages formosus]|uniref:Glutathione S-transferase theta-1-like n=1 Tax=Scleropages formosus TaxID=113540 RepID=A0A0P7V085_SCLFO|nr:Glutathione S-transferase theta-1-like [Scleropages formosus]